MRTRSGCASPGNPDRTPFAPLQRVYDGTFLGVSTMSLLRLSDRIIYPSDLKVLQRILDDVCAERHFDRGSYEAEYLASFLIELFQQGVADEGLIKALLVNHPFRTERIYH
jgi:hypothetical protein